MQKPSIGRIVHYFSNSWEVSNGQEIVAAIITAVHEDGSISLKLIPDGDAHPWYKPRVKHRESESQLGVWDWPERV